MNDKGQLISKCPLGVKTSSKKPTELFPEFCPEFFCSFLGASWKLFELPGDLVSNIINKEAQSKPKKLPGCPQEGTKISEQKSRNNSVGFLEEVLTPK